MGMSTDMAPRYLPINQAGQQMTYLLDTAGNLNLSQVQLAVPASEILLVQQDSKSDGGTPLGMCDSPVLVAADSGETLGWLGNNVLVLMSQPQEYVVVEQEVVLDSAQQQCYQVDGSSTVCVASSRLSTKQGEEYEEVADEEASATTIEDAKCWFRDSLITTAALSTLTTYVQSNGQSKVG